MVVAVAQMKEDVERRLRDASGHISTGMSGNEWTRAMELLTKVLIGEPEGRMELKRSDLLCWSAVSEFFIEHPEHLKDETRKARYDRIAQEIAIVFGG